MHGFPEEMAKASVNLMIKDKAALFWDTVPKHSLVCIISVLQMAETAALELQLEEHGSSIGEQGASRDPACCHYSRVEEGEAPFSFATSRVINRWTTFPLPSLKEWQEQSLADSDVAHSSSAFRNPERCFSLL